MFHILNARRGLPAKMPEQKRQEQIASVNAWKPGMLFAGLAQFGKWIGLAGRSLVLDRNAYQEISDNPFMTGPALMIGIVASILLSLVNSGGTINLAFMASRIALWFIATLGIFLAARLLGSKATFGMNLRVTGFAQSAAILLLLAIFPTMAPLARFVMLAVMFFATWIGAAEANDLRGWRTLLLPIVVLVILIIGGYFVQVVLQGTTFAFGALLQSMGLAQ